MQFVQACSAASVHPSSPLWQVEEVFMAGDLPSVAEILSLMRKSLSLVRP